MAKTPQGREGGREGKKEHSFPNTSETYRDQETHAGPTLVVVRLGYLHLLVAFHGVALGIDNVERSCKVPLFFCCRSNARIGVWYEPLRMQQAERQSDAVSTSRSCISSSIFAALEGIHTVLNVGHPTSVVGYRHLQNIWVALFVVISGSSSIVGNDSNLYPQTFFVGWCFFLFFSFLFFFCSNRFTRIDCIVHQFFHNLTKGIAIAVLLWWKRLLFVVSSFWIQQEYRRSALTTKTANAWVGMKGSKCHGLILMLLLLSLTVGDS